jgi:hypothetical protein
LGVETRPLLALALLVPVPSIAVLFGMVWFPGTPLGLTVFAISKIWVLIFPAFWWIFIEKQKTSCSPLARGGLGAGILTGLLMSVIIGALYFFIGARVIDHDMVAQIVNGIGMVNRESYFMGAAYWILVNSILEEYVWRWFVVYQCERLMPGWLAVPVSAIGFTFHHIWAIATFLPPPLILISTLGVFTGGAVWSWCYHHYRSIWPGYLSHAIVDLAILTIGYHLAF